MAVLDGGIEAWKEAGYSMIDPDAPHGEARDKKKSDRGDPDAGESEDSGKEEEETDDETTKAKRSSGNASDS